VRSSTFVNLALTTPMPASLKGMSSSMRDTLDSDERRKTYSLVFVYHLALTTAIALPSFGLAFLPFFLGFSLFAALKSTIFVLDTIALRYRFQRLYYSYKDVIDLRIYFFPCLVGYMLLHSAICYVPVLLIGAAISFGSIVTAVAKANFGFDFSLIESSQPVGAVTAIVIFVFGYGFLETFAVWLLSNRRMIHMVKHQAEYKPQLDELKVEQRKIKTAERREQDLTAETIVISHEEPEQHHSAPARSLPQRPATRESSIFDIDSLF
jgi:hypothetical protein